MLIGAAMIYVVLGDHREALVLSASSSWSSESPSTRSARASERSRHSASFRARAHWCCATANGSESPDATSSLATCSRFAKAIAFPPTGIARKHERDGRRVAADRRVDTGSQAPGGAGRDAHAAGGDDLPAVFSGTLVTQGGGRRARLRDRDAHRDRSHRQGVACSGSRAPPAPERNAARRRGFRALGHALSTVVTIAYGITRGDWLHGLLAGITLAMAILPEEFPVVLTVFLALGAWRISRERVLRGAPPRSRPRCNHGAVRRQDRDVDREPHGGHAHLWTLDAAAEAPHELSGLESSTTACSRASRWHSTRWTRRSTVSARSPVVRHCEPAAQLSALPEQLSVLTCGTAKGTVIAT